MSSPARGGESARPEVSVYWQPGCSSCLKAKEFVSSQGIEFESVNILETPEAMEEIITAGLRSIPVVRKREKYIYAQSIDDIASLLGLSRTETKLSKAALCERWSRVLEATRTIIQNFDPSVFDRQIMPRRDRTIRELSIHVFQIVESFLHQVEDDSIDARAIYLDPREDIKTRDDVITYAEKICAEYCNWLIAGGPETLRQRINTYYGDQPSVLVLERSVWHTAQHSRQLDHVAEGMGAELQIQAGLYEGLPLPHRLWE